MSGGDGSWMDGQKLAPHHPATLRYAPCWGILDHTQKFDPRATNCNSIDQPKHHRIHKSKANRGLKKTKHCMLITEHRATSGRSRLIRSSKSKRTACITFYTPVATVKYRHCQMGDTAALPNGRITFSMGARWLCMFSLRRQLL